MMITRLCLITLTACLALACITSVQADYSYAEGTPGTSWGFHPQNSVNPTNNVNIAILDVHKLKSVGLTYAGAAAVQNNQLPVADVEQFDCGAIITAISAGLHPAPNNPGAIPPAAPQPVAINAPPDAQAMHQHFTAQYQIQLAAYQTALRRYQAAQQMRHGVVIGVAVVDYGTAQNPDIRAFLSRSGTDNPSFVQAALDYAASTRPINTPLRTAGQWHFIDRSVDQPANAPSKFADMLKAYRSARIVQIPHVVNNNVHNTGAQDIATWVADPNAAGPVNSEGILFGFIAGSGNPNNLPDLDMMVKKWPVAGQQNQWHSEDTFHRTNCALQKLIFTLFGMGSGGTIPGNGPPLLANAQNQADGAGRARLVCAAEAAHTQTVPVKTWANVNNQPKIYAQGTLVPSCTMCQSIVPEILDGSIAPNGCGAINAVPNGAPGTCNQATVHGATCQVTCNNGYHKTLAESTCMFGTLQLQQCVHTVNTRCTVGVAQQVQNLQQQPIYTPSLNGNVVVNAKAASAGITADSYISDPRTLPHCKATLKAGHKCTLRCDDDAALQPYANTPVTCLANGQLSFPKGLPTCAKDCRTPRDNSEDQAQSRPHGPNDGRVASLNANPPFEECRGTLKFGASCSPKCPQGTQPLTYAKCGAGGNLSSQPTCTQPVVVVNHHMMVQTDSAQVKSESESESESPEAVDLPKTNSRIASAKLKHHRQSHASGALEPASDY